MDSQSKSETARPAPLVPSIATTLHFLQPKPLFDTEKPFAFRYDVAAQGIPQTNMELGPHPCTVTNIRGIEDRFTLEQHGFEVIRVGDTIPYEDFHDEVAVGGYFRVLEDVLKKRLGASSVQAFRHGVW